ncbi:biotin--[acetyl-CoA-carboxylase] ligase [Halocatena pleomorpha]|uniref:Biotin--[acetyl-CoA-carboxylase] ligase n=1 Tax=Halocatena pleomorpha TaxID=1785090 RepID=A0A3P3R407_9EURY|nr:biotin--[acetyl-CoA-carboxylase] ligase [Halocatena pleomorpha]RRJ28207.1 biotin--[acetyl-CoA-carboxylase] ligase [Halocatena pleomorpha]
MSHPRHRIARALAESDGSVSGPTLAEALSVSRTAVWKQIEGLREEGFEIESDESGYRLVAVPERGSTALSLGLDAPFEIEYHEAIDSTNRRARELAEDGATDTVVVANAQTAGRGRLNRSWESPPGGVYVSILSRPDRPPAEAPLYTLAGAVATTRAVRETGLDARIKWPNDVLLVADDTESKIAGILTEMQGETDRIAWLTVGIGVNMDDPGIEGATGLRAELDEHVSLRAFVQRLLESFEALREQDPESILASWREVAATLGQRVRVETPDGVVVGRAVDVEPPGALVVETNDETVSLHAGDCEHLRCAQLH